MSQCLVYARDTGSGGFHVPGEVKAQSQCIMLSALHFNKNTKDFVGLQLTIQNTDL